MKFEEHMANLRKGERNSQLVKLMLRGLGEKMTPEEICERIHAVHPDMTESELRHAMNTARSVKTDSICTEWNFRINLAKQSALVATQEERSFVKRMVNSASKSRFADLMSLSPIYLGQATPREQAMVYCATIFPDDRNFVFTATEESKFHKRNLDTLRKPSALFRHIADGGEIPNYSIANQFTGECDINTKSFACMNTLATRRIALVEFDEMSIEDQIRFWVGCIDSNAFDGRLRTLVFSGTKSIHALIRIDSDKDDSHSKWKIEREKLSRITESSDDPSFRADRACKDPTRLTRFAGGLRVCKDGSLSLQKLLWCAEPHIVEDLPNSGTLTEGYGLNGEYYKC